jgi:hypothetical protein
MGQVVSLFETAPLRTNGHARGEDSEEIGPAIRDIPPCGSTSPLPLDTSAIPVPSLGMDIALHPCHGLKTPFLEHQAPPEDRGHLDAPLDSSGLFAPSAVACNIYTNESNLRTDDSGQSIVPRSILREPSFVDMKTKAVKASPSIAELDHRYSLRHKDDIPKLHFDLQKLVHIAGVSLQKEQYTSIELLGFGMSNKVYLLTFEDDTEVVLRLSYERGDGNFLRDRIENEVATMKYVKEKLPEKWKSLIPTIYAWDSDLSNCVGRPYIIMEPAKGKVLSSQWNKASMMQKRNLSFQMAEFTSSLQTLGHEFCQLGAVYQRDDMYHVGSLPSSELDQDLKGPWSSTKSYLMSEVKSLLSHWQSIYFRRANEKHLFRGIHLPSIVAAFANLAELIPKFDPCALSRDKSADNLLSLFHPDLNMSNIFVEHDSMQLSGIIDWADTCVFPEWFCSQVPRYLQGPDVYCDNSPLHCLYDSKREFWGEITQLRNFYILEKSFLDPGFLYRMEIYGELHKFIECFSLDFAGLEYEELFDWIKEQGKEYRLAVPKLGNLK